MKKLIIAAIALGMSLVVFAQDKTEKAGSMGKEHKLSGTITAAHCAKEKNMTNDEACAKKCIDGGEKAVLVGDHGKLWTIDNPEAVKDHIGHHVVLDGHTNAKEGTVHVMDVKMMAKKDTDEKQKQN